MVLVLFIACVGSKTLLSRYYPKHPEKTSSVQTSQWRSFSDTPYNWYIEYPPEGNPVGIVDDLSPATLRSILFTNTHTKDWMMSVGVSKTEAKNLEEGGLVFKKDTLIGNVPAHIYEETSRPGVMFAFFLKNGLLYSIHTNKGVDHERIWKSFMFLVP